MLEWNFENYKPVYNEDREDWERQLWISMRDSSERGDFASAYAFYAIEDAIETGKYNVKEEFRGRERSLTNQKSLAYDILWAYGMENVAEARVVLQTLFALLNYTSGKPAYADWSQQSYLDILAQFDMLAGVMLVDYA